MKRLLIICPLEVQITSLAVIVIFSIKDTKPVRSVARGFMKTPVGKQVQKTYHRVRENSKLSKLNKKMLGKCDQLRDDYWEPIPASGKLILTTSALTVSSVFCYVAFARSLPGGKALRRANTNMVLAYVQKTNISGKERACLFALFLGMNGLVTVIEYGTYFGWGISISDFNRSALRIARTTCNGAYLAKYGSFELAHRLPKRVSGLSPFLDELQTKSGIVRTTLLGAAVSTTKELDLWALPQALPSIRTFPLELDVVGEVVGQ